MKNKMESFSCPAYECPKNQSESCEYCSPEDCDMFPVYFTGGEGKKECDDSPALLHVCFRCRDEWRHVPDRETYPVTAPEDFVEAIACFRSRHGAYGPLSVFYSFDKIDWYQWKDAKGEEQNQCCKCKGFFNDNELYEDPKGKACLECALMPNLSP